MGAVPDLNRILTIEGLPSRHECQALHAALTSSGVLKKSIAVGVVNLSAGSSLRRVGERRLDTEAALLSELMHGALPIQVLFDWGGVSIDLVLKRGTRRATLKSRLSTRVLVAGWQPVSLPASEGVPSSSGRACACMVWALCGAML